MRKEREGGRFGIAKEEEEEEEEEEGLENAEGTLEPSLMRVLFMAESTAARRRKKNKEVKRIQGKELNK